MLSKFISVSETRFQNTETTFKNQQASIQGLETQIVQLSKLISEQPQGSLPSNIEPNPREHFNAISTQDKQGFNAPEPELMQETVVSKGNGPHQSTRTDNMTLKKLSFKEAHEPCSRNDRGYIHEERRLWIEKPDEWQAHKPRTHDKPKLCQNEFDTSLNLLKIGDKVLLDVTDPHIVTTTPNEEIPLTILSIFPFGMVEVSHPRFGTFKVNNTRLKPYFDETDSRNEEYKLLKPASPYNGEVPCHRQNERKPPYLLRKRGRECPLLRAQPQKSVTLSHSLTLNCGLLHRLGCRRTSKMAKGNRALLTTDPCGLIRQLSIPEFGAALGLYTEEFREENELHALSRHIHFSPSKCWHTLAPNTASYNLSRSKASVLPPSLRYLHAILAHTITGRRESTGVVNTHDVYFLWLARHFGLLNTATQESSLTLIGQTSPQGISSMLSMRMIERHQGTYPPQYRLTQSIEE
ncbi:hypothetical protein GOBAR_AA17553 [Gossypium barbadense]|uniref:Arabidopsis retrotransposon Orf1 C-terminal domain-containing protein n=1 Tax=Gossypium barbadense TaxID=3634 RepID=A0A2P5XID2_GOSBA|nr:hypothetical protein GOBAR_AA17553 [Gossypium barbadense]